MPELEKDLVDCIRSGLMQAVRDRLNHQYNNPLDKVLASIIDQQAGAIKSLLTDGISEAIAAPEFRQQVKDALRHKLAKTLVDRFGGELEKAVNTLKSDPATRARITLAIDEIVKAKTQ